MSKCHHKLCREPATEAVDVGDSRLGGVFSLPRDDETRHYEGATVSRLDGPITDQLAVKIWAEMVGLGKPRKNYPRVVDIRAALGRALGAGLPSTDAELEAPDA